MLWAIKSTVSHSFSNCQKRRHSLTLTKEIIAFRVCLQNLKMKVRWSSKKNDGNLRHPHEVQIASLVIQIGSVVLNA